MAAVACSTGNLVVVHRCQGEPPGLPTRYALMEINDLGLQWLLARDMVYIHYVCVSDDIDLPVAVLKR